MSNTMITDKMQAHANELAYDRGRSIFCVSGLNI